MPDVKPRGFIFFGPSPPLGAEEGDDLPIIPPDAGFGGGIEGELGEVVCIAPRSGELTGAGPADGNFDRNGERTFVPVVFVPVMLGKLPLTFAIENLVCRRKENAPRPPV